MSKKMSAPPFLPVLASRQNRKRPEGRMALFILVIVLVELLITSLTGGISYNYMADFAFPLLIASVISMFYAWRETQGTGTLKYIRGFIGLALGWSIWFHMQFVFQSTLNMGNTGLYYQIFYAFNFF